MISHAFIPFAEGYLHYGIVLNGSWRDALDSEVADYVSEHALARMFPFHPPELHPAMSIFICRLFNPHTCSDPLRCRMTFVYLWLLSFLVVKEGFSLPSGSDSSPNGVPTKSHIVPYSLYEKQIQDKKNELSKMRKDEVPNYELDGSQPLSIYLPAFAKANSSYISDKIGTEREDVLFSSRKSAPLKYPQNSPTSPRNPIRPQTNRLNTLASSASSITQGSSIDNDSENIRHSPYSAAEKGDLTSSATYSTSATREPLHRSIFKPKPINPSTSRKVNNSPLSSMYGQRSSAENSMITRPSSMFQSSLSQNNRQPYSQPGKLHAQMAQYSKISPAPYNTLSSSPSENNIVNSIFSQSQVRYAPQNGVPISSGFNGPAPLAGSPFDLLNAINPQMGPGLLGSNGGGINPLELLGHGSAIEQISKIAKNLLAMGSGNQDIPETLFSKAASASHLEHTLLNSTNTNASTTNVTSATSLLSSLPKEQRSLLEAAIQNGELDGESMAPTLSTLVEQNKAGIIRSENKLMEWIQQNRPRTADKEMNSVKVLAADKLPYYGKYCGSFVEQTNSSKHFNVAGAVWAVDERRLIVSKFYFQPGSRTENITFWAGPLNATGTALDALPSENGFFLKPEPVDIRAFMMHEVQTVNSKLRSPFERDSKSPSGNKTAEQEEQESEGQDKLLANQLRMKRNLYEDLYSDQRKFTVPIHFSPSPGSESPLQFTVGSAEPLIRTPAPNLLENLVTAPNTTVSTTATGLNADSTNVPSGTIFPLMPMQTTPLPMLNLLNLQQPALQNAMVPLEWNAGFQPLLLTLPESKILKYVNWVSLFDHNRKQAVAYVLIPNGIAFTVPTIVQLRPLTPNGAHLVRSGPIKVMDTKTIEIEEFSLTTNGVPAWFMVGKEIMPNSNGHIVPVFNKNSRTFDCDSLRDYKNETVILRLPGTMDIKDVFWFSIFSLPTSTSLSHMYLPYNDMHLPPDLLGVQSPLCVWKPKQ
ncbi:electron transfer DM13 domain-containing protein [Ditylenchus destructor]|uniref:Electron transfer DM13 domain-containing protein n=1 Tax=Ditylenchus destructor TaxID=166010 RepID=A0AAD4NDV3_9BILA|nr:electron transfer DM13 domain-containing protein [Ditylenchus destructor]